jgi:hypothetical protein
MKTIIKNTNFKGVARSVKPDAKRRVVLPADLIREGIIYHIYANTAGQIVLDPQVTIPASEAWLFADKTALEMVDRGMVEAAKGKVTDRGSFSKYMKDAL